ncbi:hypothetical protein LJC60_10775 [Ruminococcaceae bacterium OttesenSCG-928-D13]|nr:hypothetical protein [Ruminococcaceae bacterium OttesenSCG-928-D13]
MEYKVSQDERKWTHINWTLDGVTADMLNWFWSNMEKGDNLWHPDQHHDFSWMPGYSVKEIGVLGSIHIAPQTWNDGRDLNIHIRCERIEDTPEDLRACIKYDHAYIAAGISMTGENVKPDDPSQGYRLHQWQKSDNGVVGMSTGMTVEGNDTESGLIWAEHAVEEVGNWEVFLPDLHRLYKVITRKDINPYYSLRLEGLGAQARYADI